jgi:hypothetical protein
METSPTKEDYERFQRHLDGLSDRVIADRRYQADWGNYDPTDPRNSSWKVRAANRELTARKARRDRRIQWIAIGAAFFTAWVAIVVAALAIPLVKGAVGHRQAEYDIGYEVNHKNTHVSPSSSIEAG